MEVVGKVKPTSGSSSRSSSRRPPTVDPMAHIETIYDNVVDELTGETITKRSFAVGKFLGKGGFARCYELICDATGKKYAGKVVAKTSLVKPKSKQKFQAEIRIHRSLTHARVVRFYSCFEDDENWYILLELCRNHTLSDLMRKRKHLSEYEVRYYIAQILEGVEYLHMNNVIHRDLKLGNIFLASQMQVKLGDFGLAAQLANKDERKLTVCGTPNYIAPEIISNSSSRSCSSTGASKDERQPSPSSARKGHSFEVDIWSIGVIAYTLLFGKPPFETQDIKSTYKRIKACVYSFPGHIEVSESAKDLVRRILQFEPDMRLPLASIRSHVFFTSALSGPPDSLPTSSFKMPPTALMMKGLSSSLSSSLDKQSQAPHRRTRLPLQARDMNVVDMKTNPSVTSGNPTRCSSSSSRNRAATTSPGKLMLEQTHATLERCLVTTTPTKDSSRYRGQVAKENVNVTKKTLAQDIASISLKEESLDTQQLVWIRHWVDYTSRYGMGYVLSNGHAGVYFNDSTKIILNPDTEVFQYIERTRKSSSTGHIIVGASSRHELHHVDASLKKKVTLLTHFQNYLRDHHPRDPRHDAKEDRKDDRRGHDHDDPLIVYLEQRPKVEYHDDTNFVFVRKWMKSSHAVIFCLTNGAIQANYYDHTTLMLFNDGHDCTFIDKQARAKTIRTTDALEQHPDIAKRLKYTKTILQQMISGRSTSSTTATTAMATRVSSIRC